MKRKKRGNLSGTVKGARELSIFKKDGNSGTSRNCAIRVSDDQRPDVTKAVLRPLPVVAPVVVGCQRKGPLTGELNQDTDGVSIAFSKMSDPRGELLLDFHQRWLPVLRTVKGTIYSSFNWPGGYLHHIEDAFEIAGNLFPVVSAESKINIEEALIALYFHDFERPVRYARNQGLTLPDGLYDTEVGISSAGRQSLYQEVLPNVGIMLNERELHALRYFHEAERTAAFRLMAGEVLAGFCQMCDVFSHRKAESYQRS